jgi:imidazolonepropionase-like amidohydrolase
VVIIQIKVIQMKFIIKIFSLAILLLSIGLTGYSQQLSKPTQGTYALTNATIVTVTKGTIQGTLVVEAGNISAIGPNVAIPPDAKVVDCSGLFIYPGLIDGGTQLGLVEVSSVSLTSDANELGDIIPQMQALTAVNPNATAIPVTRVEGITTTLVVPVGGTVPGTAALINLVGYTPDQMYAGFKGIVMNYPSSGRRGRRDNRTDEQRKKDEDKQLKKINDMWDKLALYHRLDSMAGTQSASSLDYNPEMEAMLPAYRGEMPVLLEVNKASSIESAIKWVKKRKINAIFTGVAEGWRVADQLAEAKISVITGPMLSMPTRASDRYDTPYANPGKMHKAGVKVAIRSNDTENVRNLPYNAGFAAAYGMGKEAALKAVTIVPAEMFGVADRLGSLEKGKSATLFVTDGDPFETKTHVKHVFIDGWNVPLDSRHIRLYHEFLERSPGLEK